MITTNFPPKLSDDQTAGLNLLFDPRGRPSRGLYQDMSVLMGKHFASSGSIAGGIALCVEVEDMDYCVEPFVAQLPDDARKNVRTVCYWTERTELPTDVPKVLTLISQSFQEPLSDVETIVVLQPTVLRPEFIETALHRLSGYVERAHVCLVAPTLIPSDVRRLSDELPEGFAGSVEAFALVQLENDLPPIVKETRYGSAWVLAGAARKAYLPNAVEAKMKASLTLEPKPDSGVKPRLPGMGNDN